MALLCLVVPALAVATTGIVYAEVVTASTITGRVADRHGVPISAAIISLYSMASGVPAEVGSTYSGVDGTYSFAGLGAGGYRLYFYPRENSTYAGNWWNDGTTSDEATTIVLDGQDSAAADDVVGELGIVKGTISGLAGQPLSNVPIQPYLVQADGELKLPLLLSSAGRDGYRLSSLKPGTYRVVFREGGYRNKEITFTIGLDEVLTRDVQLDPINVGEFTALTAQRATVSARHQGTSTIRLEIEPRRFADAVAVDASACGADSYAWKAQVFVFTPNGDNYDDYTVLTGSGVDEGIVPTVVREVQVGFFTTAPLGTHEVRLIVESTVHYRSCSPDASQLISHTWSEELITGLDVTGEFEAPAPTIAGVPRRGETLTAQVGQWDPVPASQTIRWVRDGVAIPGATGASYTLGAQDVDAQIGVEVTGSTTGYADKTMVSASAALVEGDPWVLTGPPTVSGRAVTGSDLVVVPGAWDPGTSLTYQWLRDGVAIAHATAATYRVVGVDLGARLSVTATARKPNAARISVTSEATAAILTGTLTAPTPMISGILGTGQTLASVPGPWAVGTVLAYQWLRDKRAIPNGTRPTYRLQPEDSGTRISLRVTGSLDGCPSESSTSARSAKVMLVSTPRISGARIVGSTLTVKRGTWTTGAAFAYQWLREGQPITGATRTALKLTNADAGKHMSVRVTARRGGYALVSLVSEPTPRVVSTSMARIVGAAVVGATLTTNPGTRSAGMVPSFQWLRSGKPIPGATSRTYVLTSADDGSHLRVRVLQTQPGWESVARTSRATRRVMTAGVPTVSGQPRPGSRLTAVPGSWTARVTFSYQWLRDGVAIKGAVGVRYTVRRIDAGTGLSVRVTGKRGGFATATATSGGVAVSPR